MVMARTSLNAIGHTLIPYGVAKVPRVGFSTFK